MAGLVDLSSSSRSIAGVLLLTIVAVEYGGTFMLRILRGKVPMTAFQKAFARAGHAHAGVLVILSLVAQLYADAAGLTGLSSTIGREAIPLAAILMPAGFFFSSMGRGAERPNGLVWLLYAGAVSLAAGVVTLGIGLLST